MTPANLLQLLLILTLPFLYISLGEWVVARVSRKEELLSRRDAAEAAVLFVVGLLVYLSLLFFLKCLGVPWSVATFAPFVLLIYKPSLRRYFRSIQVPPSVNFVIWFFVVSGVGVSLFWALNGIRTGWVNNYGDLSYHMGMITSFTLGENFPPEYHIYPGERLTYPFFVNVWSASLWWIDTGFKELALIFAWQWVLLWIAVFFLLRGHKYSLLPWAVLLAGGSYFHLGVKSSSLIQQGIPWTVLLDTVWVTQRTALPGVVALLAAAYLVFTKQADKGESSQLEARQRILLAGGIVGLMPLVHTHLFLVSVLILGAYLFIPCLPAFKNLDAKQIGVLTLIALGAFLVIGSAVPTLLMSPMPHSMLLRPLDAIIRIIAQIPTQLFLWPAGDPMIIRLVLVFTLIWLFCQVMRRQLRGKPDSEELLAKLEHFIAFLPGLAFAFFMLPWIVGKQHGMQVIAGWVTGKQASLQGAERILTAVTIFLMHAGQYLIVFVAFALLVKRHLLTAILSAGFVFANVVQLAFWEWDQLKVFVGLYVVLLAAWSAAESRAALWGQVVLLGVVVPAAWLCAMTFVAGKEFTVYSAKDVERAIALRQALPPDAVIAAKPDHNSLVTLTGRRLYSGYSGTLSSHGIDGYQERATLNKDLEELIRKSSAGESGNALMPEYVLWTEREARYWHSRSALKELSKGSVDFLYAMPDASKRAARD